MTPWLLLHPQEEEEEEANRPKNKQTPARQPDGADEQRGEDEEQARLVQLQEAVRWAGMQAGWPVTLTGVAVQQTDRQTGRAGGTH